METKTAQKIQATEIALERIEQRIENWWRLSDQERLQVQKTARAKDPDRSDWSVPAYLAQLTQEEQNAIAKKDFIAACGDWYSTIAATSEGWGPLPYDEYE